MINKIKGQKRMLALLAVIYGGVSLWGMPAAGWPVVSAALVGGGAFGGIALFLIRQERQTRGWRWAVGCFGLIILAAVLGGMPVLATWLTVLWPLLLGALVWFIRMRIWGEVPPAPLYYGTAFLLLWLIQRAEAVSGDETAVRTMILAVLTLLVWRQGQCVPWNRLDRVMDLMSGGVFIALVLLLVTGGGAEILFRFNLGLEKWWLPGIEAALLAGLVLLIRPLTAPCSNLTLRGCLVRSIGVCVPVRCSLLVLTELLLFRGTGIDWLNGFDLPLLMVFLTHSGKQDCVLFINDVLTGLDALLAEKGKLV